MFRKKDRPKLNELRLNTHTGLVVMFTMRELCYFGTPDELRSQYYRVQLHCLALGWWSVASFFLINPITILSNVYQWHSYKKRYNTIATPQEIDPLIT